LTTGFDLTKLEIMANVNEKPVFFFDIDNCVSVVMIIVAVKAYQILALFEKCV